jgi:hypothetical protein
MVPPGPSACTGFQPSLPRGIGRLGVNQTSRLSMTGRIRGWWCRGSQLTCDEVTGRPSSAAATKDPWAARIASLSAASSLRLGGRGRQPKAAARYPALMLGWESSQRLSFTVTSGATVLRTSRHCRQPRIFGFSWAAGSWPPPRHGRSRACRPPRGGSPRSGSPLASRSTRARSSSATPGRPRRCGAGPPAPDQILMPAQQRLGPDEQPVPARAGQHPRKRGQHRTVGPVQSGSGHLSAEHRDLAP